MTPAAFKYLGRLYETAIDAGMHLGQIQAHLKDNGITRSLWQIEQELNDVFQFPNYAASHLAPPPPNVAELDKAIDRMSERELRTAYERVW